MQMNKFRHVLDGGGYAHTFNLTTLPDGKVKVTCDNPAAAGKEWIAHTQSSAMSEAQSAMHHLALTGQL